MNLEFLFKTLYNEQCDAQGQELDGRVAVIQLLLGTLKDARGKDLVND